MRPARTKRPTLDPACAAAVDLARAAAEEVARPGEVGEYLEVAPDHDRVATHQFACLASAYRGWRWSVTVARAARAKHVTVSEAVLLPGPEALLAPEWVPWHERLRPGDLGIGDLLATPKHDPRLAPGYTDTGDDADQALIWELGLGRARVLSLEGRDDAAKRWMSGEPGPNTALARAAPAQCSTCGFFVPLSGGLRQAFGVCANDLAPDDGKVVSADHGCGAHSEAMVMAAEPERLEYVVDRPEEEEEVEVEVSPGSVDEGGSEPLGHS